MCRAERLDRQAAAPVEAHKAKRVPNVLAMCARELPAASSRATMRATVPEKCGHLLASQSGGKPLFIPLALASIVFLSAMLITMALFLRGRWDHMEPPDDRPRRRS
jgi:hypothetical protein